MLESLLLSKLPTIGYIRNKKVLISTLCGHHETNGTICSGKNWANPAETFPALISLLDCDEYLHSIASGLVISVGGLSEAVSKESTAALLSWCRDKRDRNNYRSLELLASSLLDTFEAYKFGDRRLHIIIFPPLL